MILLMSLIRCVCVLKKKNMYLNIQPGKVSLLYNLAVCFAADRGRVRIILLSHFFAPAAKTEEACRRGVGLTWSQRLKCRVIPTGCMRCSLFNGSSISILNQAHDSTCRAVICIPAWVAGRLGMNLSGGQLNWLLRLCSVLVL